jgi:methionine synthase I (cobalamin-dependent)
MVDKLISFLEQYPYVLGDGAMGTMLQAAGLVTGGLSEEWNASHPDTVRRIHREYVSAGAQVITANSFGGNRYRLAREDLQNRARELNLTAARLAREVVSETTHPVLVAACIGPTGEIFAPLGKLEPRDAEDAYAEQARALADGGADFILIETMSALEELEAAVKGARRATNLPIAATMTFDTNFRTMMGVKPAAAVQAIRSFGVRVIGANCGNGPGEIERVIGEMAAAAAEDVFLVAQSNAGLPKFDAESGQMRYDGTPDVMAAYAVKVRDLGARYIGACCGSTPAHIRAMGEALKSRGAEEQRSGGAIE